MLNKSIQEQGPQPYHGYDGEGSDSGTCETALFARGQLFGPAFTY